LKSKRVYIIAEAGVNHNGCIKTAKKLIDYASNSGADAIKFQTFKADNLVTSYAKKAEYQKQINNYEENQYEMIKRLELKYSDHIILSQYAFEKKIEFLSTPFDLESIDLLLKLGLKKFKIPSGEITNLPYLEKVGQLNKEIILSTGMSTLNEIEQAIDILISSGSQKENLTVLHCNTEYPTPLIDVNLKAMVNIGKKFNVNFGYSDHTLGVYIPVAAVSMGAKIIEKHFTCDKNMEGPDHKASINPLELDEMVKLIRNTEIALGKSIKEPTASEFKNIKIARKSIVAKTFIKKGENFSLNNLTTKRPGDGISPMKWHEVLKLVAKKDFKKDDLIEI
tara:strand:+ start:1753 stop:2763 length:1011 start_codon:yes stop_codon:yes gene_type:complete